MPNHENPVKLLIRYPALSFCSMVGRSRRRLPWETEAPRVRTPTGLMVARTGPSIIGMSLGVAGASQGVSGAKGYSYTSAVHDIENQAEPVRLEGRSVC